MLVNSGEFKWSESAICTASHGAVRRTPSVPISLDHGTDIASMIQLIPQIIINFRRHNTIGLQRSMMLLWACAGVPLGAYNVTANFNIALQIQPQILTILSLITWIQCYYYEDVSLVSESSLPKICLILNCSRNGVNANAVLPYLELVLYSEVWKRL